MTRDDPSLQAQLERLIVQTGVAPGATAAIAKRTETGWRVATAAAGRICTAESAESPSGPVRSDTLYDLASVTKPVVALLCARLAAAGVVSLSAPLASLLVEARGTPSEHVPLEALLSHRAGLLAHLELFEPLRRSEQLELGFALRAAANARRAECEGPLPPHGFTPLYSDLGYLLLGEALRRAGGCDLDVLIDQQINQPCGTTLLSARQWHQRGAFLERVAPTEIVPWRGGLVHGVVHDENAWAFARDGSAGNAGLFADALNVTHLGMAVLDALAGRSNAFLSSHAVAQLIAPRPGGTLRAGFDGKSEQGSSAGSQFGPASFGHLGFTGTSLWCDPDAGVVAVVLSNRVNPSRNNNLHRQYRPLLSDALFLLAQTDLAQTDLPAAT